MSSTAQLIVDLMYRANTSGLNDAKKSLVELVKEQEEYAKKVEAAEKSVAESDKRLAEARKALGEAIKNASPDTQKFTQELDKAKQEADRASAALQNLKDNAVSVLSVMADKAGVAGKAMTTYLTGSLVDLGKQSVSAAVDFESAFTGVTKTVDGSAEQIEALKGRIVEMSSTMPFAATEIANVAQAAGQLGVGMEGIDAFTNTMLQLGTATDMGAEQAATEIARFANVTGMSLDQVDRFGSAIVALGNSFATSESEIMALASRLASAGSMVGFTDAEILGLSASLSSVGVEAEAGGTALSKFLLDIDIAADSGGEALDEYAKVAGMTAKEFQALWASDPAAGFTSIISGINGMQKAGANTAVTLAQLGVADVRTRDALMKTVNAVDSLGGAFNIANQAFKENTALSAINRNVVDSSPTWGAMVKMHGNVHLFISIPTNKSAFMIPFLFPQ
ncbi:MAG: phage tail tape measure protein [Oscillospiraceae bacterium]|jgi:TP901 family phage tail tape measure protein|nr:phage tail tape measure protein [Oscillospiraceae bacterium]